MSIALNISLLIMSDEEALPDLDEFIADVTSDVLIGESRPSLCVAVF